MRNRRHKTIGPSRSSRLRPSPEIVYRQMQTCSEHGSIYGEPAPTTGFSNQVQSYRAWSGVRTPGFASVKKRNLPINPHHVYMYTVSDGGIVEKYWLKPIPNDHSYGFGPYPFGGGYGSAPPVPQHDLSPRNAAVSKLAEFAGQEVNNIAQDLVQVNQLTRAVVDTCKRLTGAIHALKSKNLPLAVSILWQKEQPRFRRGFDPTIPIGKGQYGRYKQVTPYTAGNSLAKNWLELQYGWKPLLQDVEGAAKSLAYLNAGTFMVQTARSSKSKTSTTGGTCTVNGNPAGHWTIISKTEIRFGMRFKIGEPLEAFLSQTGFNNPINLLWEVIPYSFVVDWFLPIGEYLTGLHHWDGVSFVDGYETRFTRQSAMYDVDYYKDLPGSTDIRYGHYSQDAVLMDRLKLTDFPSMSLPSWKNPISTTHALNALALLRAAFAGDKFYGR